MFLCWPVFSFGERNLTNDGSLMARGHVPKEVGPVGFSGTLGWGTSGVSAVTRLPDGDPMGIAEDQGHLLQDAQQKIRRKVESFLSSWCLILLMLNVLCSSKIEYFNTQPFQLRFKLKHISSIS